VSVSPVFLKLFELGDVRVALVEEAALLESEVAEVFTEAQEDFRLDEGLAVYGVWFVGELVSQLAAADGIDSGFEGRDAEETPFSIGDGLGERFSSSVAGACLAKCRSRCCR